MAKIVRLTERDMSRLVRRVINEQRLLNEGIVQYMEIKDLNNYVKSGTYERPVNIGMYPGEDGPFVVVPSGNWEGPKHFQLIGNDETPTQPTNQQTSKQ
jgi:hypothetical protein